MRHFYGVDPADVRHYHLVLDTTALAWDLCTELITRAAGSLAPTPRR